MRENCHFLSGNALKFIAAAAMVIDHVGVILFPSVLFLRIIGRLAFPVFAFMIAEGCRYTRNKVRYFFTLFGVGALCQSVLFFYNGSLEMNILLTFSLSVLLIYAMQYFKEQLFLPQCDFLKLWGALVLFALLLFGVILLGFYVDLDYGATGAMVAMYAALLHPPKRSADTWLHRIDKPFWHVLVMGLGLLVLALDDGGIQYFSLFSIPLLLLYSGKRGRWKTKYFFYIFYPAHLLLLQGIAWLLF